MPMWAHIQNISGLDLYVSYDEVKIRRITAQKPEAGFNDSLPDRFAYIGDYLTDHTKQPFLIEALDDLDFSWTTDFQYKIYKAASLIPCGTLVSYGALAELAGRPKAARAVGSAMTNNRFSIIIPAHRVVGVGRKISGGTCNGSDYRIMLLEAEGVYDYK